MDALETRHQTGEGKKATQPGGISGGVVWKVERSSPRLKGVKRGEEGDRSGRGQEAQSPHSGGTCEERSIGGGPG